MLAFCAGVAAWPPHADIVAVPQLLAEPETPPRSEDLATTRELVRQQLVSWGVPAELALRRAERLSPADLAGFSYVLERGARASRGDGIWSQLALPFVLLVLPITDTLASP